MPTWSDVLSHLERHDPEGLVSAAGKPRGQVVNAIEDGIESLARCPRPVRKGDLAQAMGCHASVVDHWAMRNDVDLVAPLVAMEVGRPAGEHLTLAWVRGRTGKSLRAAREPGALLPAEPVGVDRLAGEPHEALAGWAVVPDGETVAGVVLETLAPMLKGTVDDPAVVRRAGTDLVERTEGEPRFCPPVDPAELLGGLLARRRTAVGGLTLGRVEPASLDADLVGPVSPEMRAALGAWRQVARHLRPPLVVHAVPYGFVKGPPGEPYTAAGHWNPGLDRRFLDALVDDGPCAAFAFGLAAEDGEAEWIERLATAEHTGAELREALLYGGGDVDAESITGHVVRVRGAVLHDRTAGRRVDLLVHGDVAEATAWTIAAGTTEDEAETLARLLEWHEGAEPDASSPVEEQVLSFVEHYGVLRIQATSTDVRRFLRAMALAGHARRAVTPGFKELPAPS